MLRGTSSGWIACRWAVHPRHDRCTGKVEPNPILVLKGIPSDASSHRHLCFALDTGSLSVAKELCHCLILAVAIGRRSRLDKLLLSHLHYHYLLVGCRPISISVCFKLSSAHADFPELHCIISSSPASDMSVVYVSVSHLPVGEGCP